MLQSTFVKTEKHLTRLHTARWYTERPVSAATNRYCRFWSAKTNVAFQERPSRPDWSCILCLCECVSGCWGEEGRGGLLILSVAAAPLIPVPQRCPNFTLLCEPNYLHLPFFFSLPAGSARLSGLDSCFKSYNIAHKYTNTHVPAPQSRTAGAVWVE